MASGPLFRNDYNPQFSGHETFPLRYGWLKKAFDRVLETEHRADNRSECWDEDAIARFGVGKNMVASMRHWAKAAGVILEPTASSVRTTELGRLIFGPDGLDPYIEHPATLWLIHWQLAAREEKTTWFWAFSHCPAVTFERDGLVKKLQRLARDRNWSRIANATIQKDVSCFIRTYVAKRLHRNCGHDDALESPLTELGLIKSIGTKDGFRFVRGPKTNLRNGVFTYALMDFWSRRAPSFKTLSFDVIAHDPGGPGRVFQFDENDVADRLSALHDITGGALSWSEATGLRQVSRKIDLGEQVALSWLQGDYLTLAQNEAA